MKHKYILGLIGLWIAPALLLIALDKASLNQSGMGLLLLCVWFIIGFIKMAKQKDVIISFLVSVIVNSMVLAIAYSDQNMIGVTIIFMWIAMALALIPITIIQKIRS